MSEVDISGLSSCALEADNLGVYRRLGFLYNLSTWFVESRHYLCQSNQFIKKETVMNRWIIALTEAIFAVILAVAIPAATYAEQPSFDHFGKKAACDHLRLIIWEVERPWPRGIPDENWKLLTSAGRLSFDHLGVKALPGRKGRGGPAVAAHCSAGVPYDWTYNTQEAWDMWRKLIKGQTSKLAAVPAIWNPDGDPFSWSGGLNSVKPHHKGGEFYGHVADRLHGTCGGVIRWVQGLHERVGCWGH